MTRSSIEKAERAIQARALLENTIFKEVIEGMKDDAVQSIETGVAGEHQLTNCYTLSVLRHIIGRINAIIDDERFVKRTGS